MDSWHGRSTVTVQSMTHGSGQYLFRHHLHDTQLKVVCTEVGPRSAIICFWRNRPSVCCFWARRHVSCQNVMQDVSLFLFGTQGFSKRAIEEGKQALLSWCLGYKQVLHQSKGLWAMVAPACDSFAMKLASDRDGHPHEGRRGWGASIHVHLMKLELKQGDKCEGKVRWGEQKFFMDNWDEVRYGNHVSKRVRWDSQLISSVSWIITEINFVCW